MMTYDSITEDGRLWAVKYDDCAENVLYMLFEQWNDVTWLYQFFKENMDDLMSYFKITDVNEAIYDTIEDSERLQCLIMDISPDADLDRLFRPLENSRFADMLLGKEKARLKENLCNQASSRSLCYYRWSHKTHPHHAGARAYAP